MVMYPFKPSGGKETDTSSPLSVAVVTAHIHHTQKRHFLKTKVTFDVRHDRPQCSKVSNFARRHLLVVHWTTKKVRCVLAARVKISEIKRQIIDHMLAFNYTSILYKFHLFFPIQKLQPQLQGSCWDAWKNMVLSWFQLDAFSHQIINWPSNKKMFFRKKKAV